MSVENIFESASITTILDLDTELKITSFNVGGVIRKADGYASLREFLNRHKKSSYIAMQEFPKNIDDEVCHIFDEYGFEFITGKPDKHVVTAIHKKNRNNMVVFESENDLEQNNFYAIFDKQNKITIINTYIPNRYTRKYGCPVMTIEKLFDFLLDIPNVKEQKILLCGDFNTPLWYQYYEDSATIGWCSNEQRIFKQKISNMIMDLMKMAHLEDLGAHNNNIHTTFGGTKNNTARIDYFLSNMPGASYVDSNYYKSQHKAIVCYVFDTVINEESCWNSIST